MRGIWVLAVQHQTVLFAIVGALVGALSIGWLRPSRELSTRIRHPEISLPGMGLLLYPNVLARLVNLVVEAVWRWRHLILALSFGLITGALIGAREPISKATVLEFPKPLCQSGKSDLLIFLHGWNGDSSGTWKQFPQFACDDPELKGVTVLSLNYPTYILDANLGIDKTASWINERLEANHIYPRYEHVAIIAHSIGGLVARELVLAAHGGGHSEQYGVIVEIATPHQGANRPAQIISALGLPGGDLVSQVSPNSQFLQYLRNDWNNLRAHPVTDCFTGLQDLLVSSDSATSQCDHFQDIPGNDHRALAKPESRTDDRYTLPMAYVKQYFGKQLSSAPLFHAIDHMRGEFEAIPNNPALAHKVHEDALGAIAQANELSDARLDLANRIAKYEYGQYAYVMAASTDTNPGTRLQLVDNSLAFGVEGRRLLRDLETRVTDAVRLDKFDDEARRAREWTQRDKPDWRMAYLSAMAWCIRYHATHARDAVRNAKREWNSIDGGFRDLYKKSTPELRACVQP